MGNEQFGINNIDRKKVVKKLRKETNSEIGEYASYGEYRSAKDKKTRDAVNKLVDGIMEHNSNLRPSTVGVSEAGNNGDSGKIAEIKEEISQEGETGEGEENREYTDLPGIVLDENGKFLRFTDDNKKLEQIGEEQNEKEPQEPALIKVENDLSKPEEGKEHSSWFGLKSKIGAWFSRKSERKIEVPKIDKNEEKETKEKKLKIENNLKVEDILKIGTDYFSKRDLRRFKVMGYGKNILGRKIVKLEFTYKDGRGYTHKEKWTATEKEVLEDFKDGKIQIYEKTKTPETSSTGVLAGMKALPENGSPDNSLNQVEPTVKDPEVEIKKVENPEGETPAPASIAEVLPAEKVDREIEKDEYEGMKNDLRIIDKLLKESKGIVNISESDFKSEKSKEMYRNFKHILDGKPVSFNKDELLKIGNEIEKNLSGSKIITREEIEKREKDKERQKAIDFELSMDLKMLNRMIKESKGIINISESDFQSEKGKEMYRNFKHIPDGRPVSFNKDELLKIGNNLENFLIELQKKSK